MNLVERINCHSGVFLCPKCQRTVVRSRSNGKRDKTCGCGRHHENHGLSKLPETQVLYGRWLAMQDRCRNPKCKAYPYYGARGVRVCRAWRSFKAFYKWALRTGFRKELEIDRRNTLKGYNPQNCRWVTRRQNCRNKRSDKLTEEKVRELRWLASRGVSEHVLASKFGICHEHAKRVARGLFWKVEMATPFALK